VPPSLGLYPTHIVLLPRSSNKGGPLALPFPCRKYSPNLERIYWWNLANFICKYKGTVELLFTYWDSLVCSLLSYLKTYPVFRP